MRFQTHLCVGFCSRTKWILHAGGQLEGNALIEVGFQTFSAHQDAPREMRDKHDNIMHTCAKWSNEFGAMPVGLHKLSSQPCPRTLLLLLLTDWFFKRF